MKNEIIIPKQGLKQTVSFLRTLNNLNEGRDKNLAEFHKTIADSLEWWIERAEEDEHVKKVMNGIIKN